MKSSMKKIDGWPMIGASSAQALQRAGQVAGAGRMQADRHAGLGRGRPERLEVGIVQRPARCTGWGG